MAGTECAIRFGRFGRQFANRSAARPSFVPDGTGIFTGQMLQLPILFFKFGKTSDLPHEKNIFYSDRMRYFSFCFGSVII
ncbi:hypothetical protein [Alistipes sp.]|jgi:hypothetical protein|uniref:hypothetical protein n=1 Tax=Alistipes sp. TaxID=1872444 RepID=UPI003AB0780E